MTKSITKFAMLAMATLAINAAGIADAQLTSYSQTFDGLTPSASVLADDGWAFFSDNGGLGNYNGPAPGAGPQISALADDGMGNQYINFYANYDNTAVHGNAALTENISLFQSQTFSGAEAAAMATWNFNFDYASNAAAPLTGDTTTGAFIRVFDGVFNLLDEQTLDTTAATTAFTGGLLTQTFNPLWTGGGIVQFGFNNAVGEFNGSGIFYDNTSFSNASVVPEPGSLALVALAGLGAIVRRRRR